VATSTLIYIICKNVEIFTKNKLKDYFLKFQRKIKNYTLSTEGGAQSPGCNVLLPRHYATHNDWGRPV
jgi:hypothetical protein